MNRLVTCFSLFAILLTSGCARRMPVLDLSRVEPTVLQRCLKHGVLILEDERYEDYWARSYDNYKARLLGQMGSSTVALTLPTAVRRITLRIESLEGARAASYMEVVHYRELIPTVEARAWTKEGKLRAMNVLQVGVTPAAEWPCRKGYPRRSKFRIGPLNVGDTVEIKYPLSGPEQELWRFGDHRFCVMTSRATFGHEHDTGSTRLDMETVTIDAQNVIERTTSDGEWPMTYEASRAIEPAPVTLLPFVMRSGRCRGWDYLNARLFLTPVWLAREGDLDAPEEVLPAALLKEAPAGQRTERIHQVGRWLKRFAVVEQQVSYWMRWLPREPGVMALSRGAGSQGGLATLAFRVLEEGGLEPRFAALHSRPELPFVEKFAAPAQFDSLAVVVAGDDGQDRWLVPGLPYSSDKPVPDAIRGHKALVMERWIAERYSGGGSCWPEFETLFSCYNPSRGLESMKLVTP